MITYRDPIVHTPPMQVAPLTGGEPTQRGAKVDGGATGGGKGEEGIEGGGGGAIGGSGMEDDGEEGEGEGEGEGFGGVGGTAGIGNRSTVSKKSELAGSLETRR